MDPQRLGQQPVLGSVTGVDNSPDLLSSIDVGDTGASNAHVAVDDVSVGTTKR